MPFNHGYFLYLVKLSERILQCPNLALERGLAISLMIF